MAIRTVLLSTDLLPRVQAYQFGLFDDLQPSFRAWVARIVSFDTKRQQTMVQLPTDQGATALDEYFVNAATDRAFLLHHAIATGASLPRVLRWVACFGDELVSRYTMDCAATHGRLDVLEWLHQHRDEGCTTDAMDFAALRGHVDVVRFLHERRTEGATFLAMDFAAGQGHGDVVRFLHERRTEGCSTMAMDTAASNGHLEMVRFLHQERHEGHTMKAMDGATKYHHDHVVAYLQGMT
ncbi:Aste57867_11522 [Aphanomyces stellatus]|uniref:Aste57867_11522 protein n=1 Tax=Aphanomyces stellatus TaxID=120398 RepID=A0A485KT78_9STRA|nr:hypothetical protein As57867_011479 [Aphanomyces stellatus]VFT88383.1 Aste57867_11522 [Aphanomyces stellatus]